MAGEPESASRAQVSPIDPHGRVIDPVVLSLAEKFAARLSRYAEQTVGDPAVAMSLLEESAAAVSRIRRLNPQQPISNLRAYLFRGFMRRLNRARLREIRLLRHYEDHPVEATFDPSAAIEASILNDEITARCDPVAKDMYYRRGQGFTWREIANVYGISEQAAKARFSAAMKRVRKRLGLEDKPWAKE